jgi:hypothetical protein
MRAEALFALPRQVQPAAAPVAAAVRKPARPQADPDRMAAAIRAGTGQPVVARLYAEPSGTTVALLPEPPPEARLPLPLVQRFCNLVAAESRPETRASLAAVLRAGTGPTLREVMEAYVADNGDGGEPAAEPAAPEPAEPPRFSLLEQTLPGAARRMA